MALLEKDYLQARRDNFRNVDTFYTTNAEKLRAELARENKTQGVQALDAFLQTIHKSPSPSPIPAVAGSSHKLPAK